MMDESETHRRGSDRTLRPRRPFDFAPITPPKHPRLDLPIITSPRVVMIRARSWTVGRSVEGRRRTGGWVHALARRVDPLMRRRRRQSLLVLPSSLFLLLGSKGEAVVNGDDRRRSPARSGEDGVRDGGGWRSSTGSVDQTRSRFRLRPHGHLFSLFTRQHKVRRNVNCVDLEDVL